MAAELGVPMLYLEKSPDVEACISGLIDTIIRSTSGFRFKVVKHAFFWSVHAVLLHYRAKRGQVQCSDLLHIIPELAKPLSSSAPLQYLLWGHRACAV